MSLEITLQVKGLNYSEDGSSHLAERLVNFLRGLEGVLGVGYDAGTQRFALNYDQNRTTILRILNQIEGLGQRAGQVYRPTDVQPSQGCSFVCDSIEPEPFAQKADLTLSDRTR